MSDMEIQYQEVSADTVVAFFVKAYANPPEDYRWFYDAAKQTFVFRLYVRKALDTPQPPRPR